MLLVKGLIWKVNGQEKPDLRHFKLSVLNGFMEILSKLRCFNF